MRVRAARREGARWTRLAVLLAGGSALLMLLLGPLQARASWPWRAVRYHGYRLTVPARWPVFDLAGHPTTCVRFNRHAVYLGRPGAHQLCPSQVLGRTEAILVQPLAASSPSVRGAAQGLPAPSLASADGPQGTEGLLVDRSRGVVITAT